MGKGIALRFKKVYPEMFRQYRDHCEHGRFKIGNLLLYKTPHKWILNFPTKKHWRHPSRPEYIEAGLKKFRERCAEMGIASVAFPQLGCGNGELDFDSQVRPLMERYLDNLSIPVLIHVRQNLVDTPEHHDPKRIAEWLRSEPSALPFDEVWQDLVDVLSKEAEFQTRTTQTRFSVQLATDPPELVVVSSGRKSARITEEELIDFWQQLRDHGLTHRGIAPNHRHLSYLMPVFEHLPYIRQVAVSELASRLTSNPAAALHVIPPPVNSNPPQWNLFGSTASAAQA